MNIPNPLKTYQANDTLLNGHIILITGAGDGIGAAVAKDCAAKGATVILLGKTVKKLEKVYDEIVHAGHPEPAIYPLDLLQPVKNTISNSRILLKRNLADWMGWHTTLAFG